MKNILLRKSGMSTTVSVVAVIVALLVGIGGTYALTSSMGSASTTTTTTTTTLNGGGVSTTTMTTTVSSTMATQAALAQAECAKQTNNVCLTIYSTMDSDIWTNQMAPVFYAQYPWAQGKVSFVNLRHSEVSAKPISEYQAGKVQADMVESSLGAVYPIIVAGAVQNYTSPLIQEMNWPVGYYDPQGSWIAVNELPSDIIWNTALMSQLNLPIPQTWTDLANPVYKGEIAMATGSTMSTTASVLYYEWTQLGNSSWNQFMQGLAANKPNEVGSPGGVSDAVVSGQYALGIGLYNDCVAAKLNPNATVGCTLTGTILDNPAMEAILNGAPHPQMARLLEDFWISYAGQATYVSAGYIPVDSSLATAFSTQLGLPSGITSVNAFGSNPNAIMADSTYWSNLWQSYLGF